MNKDERDKLITENMRLVYYLVRKYYPTYIGNEDVIQEGMVGLIKAADTWDEEKRSFSTYATNCIINQIRMYFRREMKHPTYKPLDDVICKDGSSKGLTLGDVLPGEEDVDLGGIVFEMFLETLSEEELEFVEMCNTMRHQDIAKVLGVSQPQVSRLKKLLGRKWRKFNGEDSN